MMVVRDGQRSTRLHRIRPSIYMGLLLLLLPFSQITPLPHLFSATRQLCLEEILRMPLSDFEPIGLSASEPLGSLLAITMWSRSQLLVIRVSPDGRKVIRTTRAELPQLNLASATVTGLDSDRPVVELFDARSREVRTMTLAARVSTTARETTVAASTVAALRGPQGWIQAHKSFDTLVDSAIVVVARSEVSTDVAPSISKDSDPTSAARRRIDEILHIRSGSNGELLVQEASFPFSTISFTEALVETRRTLPEPDRLRDALAESDLRYVIATPALAVDSAVLNTFVALRSGRRISALRFRDGISIRYRSIPNDLAFLASVPTQKLLISTRSGQPYELVVFKWRWIDQRAGCTEPPTEGGSR